MDYLVTFEDGSTGHLTHYGVKGMKWGVWNAETAAKYGQASNSFQGGGGGMLDEDDREDSETAKDAKSEAAAVIDALLHAPQRFDEAVSTARKKIDEWGSHLPQNPLYSLKKRTEEAEASGESDAARKRLEERYSNENVLGKTKTKQLPPRARGIVEKPHNSQAKPTGGLAARLTTADIPSSLGQRHKATPEEKRRMSYQKESRLNRMEFYGDRKGYEKAQKRTDNYYGKGSKLAQLAEEQRRRKSRKETRVQVNGKAKK